MQSQQHRFWFAPNAPPADEQAELNTSRQLHLMFDACQFDDEKVRVRADAFDHAAIGIEIVDPVTGKIIAVNAAFAAAHGLTVEQAQQGCFTRHYAKEEHPRLPWLIAEADRSGNVVFETQRVRIDGATFPAQMNVIAPRNPDGEIPYHISYLTDISERKRVEQAMRRAAKMESVGGLIGGMAHDFNNILGVIIGNLGLAERLLRDGSEARELVREAIDAASRGAELTSSLLAYARHQSHSPVHLDLNALVANMHRLLSRILGERIEMVVDLAPDLWPVKADASQVESCIVNLAANARDAMSNHGTLTIQTENRRIDNEFAKLNPTVKPGDYVVVAVTDTGAGMSPEVMAKVFEPFFTTKDCGKGTGLGLSMVLGFISQSGGHVSIRSEIGVGTTFSVFIPRTADGPHRLDQPLDRSSAVPERGNQETVLVVEDNTAMRTVVARNLAALNYKVVGAVDAHAALAALAANKITLLFCDVVMPGNIDGTALAKLVRTKWPSVKVLMSSGFTCGRDSEHHEGLAAAMPILRKPYTQAELSRAIRAVLAADPVV